MNARKQRLRHTDGRVIDDPLRRVRARSVGLVEDRGEFREIRLELADRDRKAAAHLIEPARIHHAHDRKVARHPVERVEPKHPPDSIWRHVGGAAGEKLRHSSPSALARHIVRKRIEKE